MAISKFNYNSFNVTPVASKALAFDADADGFTTASGSSMILIKTLTASSGSTLSFVNGTDGVVLDDTYPLYKFEFINIHADTRNAEWTVNFRDGGSSYDATKTSTFFQSFHYESDSNAALQYRTEKDLAQSTGAQLLTFENHEDADMNLGGTLMLYNPSSTTFVKHYMCRLNFSNANFSQECHTAGYCNVTAAIDGVQFAMASGTFDGNVKLYGIADS